MQSNKGRFKCPHEAQAVWSLFVRTYPWRIVKDFISGYPTVEYYLSELATNLHKARLIHGTFYDEYGRIEDKDLAQEFWMSYLFDRLDSDIIDIAHDKKIRGTIFY